MSDRVKIEMKPCTEVGTCQVCLDQATSRDLTGAMAYTVKSVDRGTSVLVICEPCLLATFNASSVQSRMGTPLDQGALYSWPLRAPGENGEVRHAVVVIIYPPAALRDASRDVIDLYVQTKKKGILAGIVEEIHRSYVSEPADGTAARNVAAALERHADTLAGK